MLVDVVPVGATTGIVAGLGDIKLCGVRAHKGEAGCILYSGTAATEANMVARVGTTAGLMIQMFAKDREVPMNGVYASLESEKGCIIYYLRND